ncbi:PspC domain-containing protein [Nanoarchaeota archaeon]
MSKQKKLTRSKKERIIAGVCGGLAKYFDTDTSLVRILWVIGTLITGVVGGVIAYIVAWIIIPEEH